MAQPGYSSYHPQAAYGYSQVQAPQAYDQRMEPQNASYYQQRSYSPLPQQQPQSYTPPLQRPTSAMNHAPYSPAQPPNPMSAPPPQYDSYYPRAPPSPQPQVQTHIPNPYPSPISPASPQVSTAHSTRRPLPSPRGLPQPPINGTIPTPQPTPSPGPYAGAHRPTQSVPNVYPPQPSSNSITRIPSGQDILQMPSTFSSIPASSPRPLPLPRSSGSVDLSAGQSQNQSQFIAQSPPKRALPAPGLSSLDQRKSEPVSAAGSKFVPLWKRALPQPGVPSIVGSTQTSQVQPLLERRSTVSGGARPLPSPGRMTSAVSVPQDGLTRPTTLPPPLQLQNASSPSQAGKPSQPTPPSPLPIATPSTPRTPHGSRFNVRERSRTLPLPTAAPTGPLPPEPSSPNSVAGQRRSDTPASSDDEELTNALLERHARAPSPQFGIRDLPSRSHPPPYDNDTTQITPRPRRELPSPGPPLLNLGGQAEGSLALRMAATSLRSTSPPSRPTHEQSQSMSSPAMARPMPQPPAQRQPPPQLQQPGGWPAALPPLPRAPTSPNPISPISPPATQSAFAQMQARTLPTPTRSNTTAGAVSSPFPRSPRKPDLDLNLDDAPPPSLRRSPGPPPSAFPQHQQKLRSPTNFSSPLPSTPQMQPGPLSSGVPTARGQLQRAASDASVFTLSSFPTPPAHVNAPPLPSSLKKGGFSSLPGSATPTGAGFNRPPSPTKQQPFQRPPSPAKPQVVAPTQQPQPPSEPAKPQWKSTISSPSKQWQTTVTAPSSRQWQSTIVPPTQQQSNQGPPTPKSFSSARSQSPVRFQPPAPAATHNRNEASGTPRIPKISFPASADGDSDEEDDLDGPAINISGPGSSGPPALPRISFGDDNDNDGGIPSINVGGADDAPPSVPQISLPGNPSAPPQSQRRHQPQTQKMQQTLSNPRMEAAKRSGLVCGGCGGPIIGRIVSAMDMRWHPGCFRCCVCDELLENLSSYAHDGRPFCHLDYHEVRYHRSPSGMPLTKLTALCSVRSNSRRGAIIARRRSSTSGSSRSTIPSWASGRITSSTSSVPSAATRSCRRRTRVPHRARSRAMARSRRARRTTSGLQCTRVTHIVRRATYACGCPSVRSAKGAYATECRLSRRLAGSGAGSASLARYVAVLSPHHLLSVVVS